MVFNKLVISSFDIKPSELNDINKNFAFILLTNSLNDS